MSALNPLPLPVPLSKSSRNPCTRIECKSFQSYICSNSIRASLDEGDNSFEVHEKDELLYEDKSVGIQEYEDYLIINGKRLDKPYVEKPVNAEDHEIKIYYSSQGPCGAGYNVLFRKINNYCS